jgi:hypothetical protein
MARQAAPRPHLLRDAGFVLRSHRTSRQDEKCSDRILNRGSAQARLAIGSDQTGSVPSDRSAHRCTSRPSGPNGRLRRERPRLAGRCRGSGKPDVFLSRVRHRRRRPGKPVAESPRLRRPWRAIGFKAFLRRRVRNVPDRFRPWDVLSFHGLCSPSRFHLFRRPITTVLPVLAPGFRRRTPRGESASASVGRAGPRGSRVSDDPSEIRRPAPCVALRRCVGCCSFLPALRLATENEVVRPGLPSLSGTGVARPFGTVALRTTLAGRLRASVTRHAPTFMGFFTFKERSEERFSSFEKLLSDRFSKSVCPLEPFT